MTPLQVIMLDIEIELGKARAKFPMPKHTMNALTEEAGELAKALLQKEMEPDKMVTSSDIYKEAVQVAVMAIRVATEGDTTFPSYRPLAGPDGV